MNLESMMDELFRCTSTGDVDGVAALCAPGMHFKQNSGEDGDLAALLALVGGLAGAGVAVNYSDVRRVVGQQSVAEQHLVTLRRSDGAEANVDVCAVVRFDGDGRVERLDEYFDPSPVAHLLA